MLSRCLSRCALLTVGGALIAGCHFTPPRHASTDSRSASAPSPKARRASAAVSESDLVEAHARYAAAVVHDLDNEPELALRDYDEAALKDPANEALVLEVSGRLLQAGHLDKALELLTRATSLPDASGALFARLGLTYARLDKTDLAMQANRQAIQKDPASLAGYRNLYLNYLQAGRREDAVAVLDKAGGVAHADAEFLIGLSELYANFASRFPVQKDQANVHALALLERAARFKSEDPDLELRLADGLNLMGKYDQAAQIYQDLLKQLPDATYVRANIRAKLANLYLRANDPESAARQLEALIQDNPTDAQAYFLLGGIHYDEKQYEAAADCFSKTLLLDPNFEPVYPHLAQAQIAANENRQALATLGNARRKFGQNFLVEYFSGIASSGLKEYTNAVNHFTAAEIAARAANQPSRLDDVFYFQFGAACERAGYYAQAEQNFEKCLKRSPQFAEALNYLGYMWAERGEKLDRARDFIEKALKLEPQNAAYLDSMGWVLFKLHEPKEALEYILKAIKNSPEPDPTVYDHLGDVYAAVGETGKAREAWQKSLSLEHNDQVRRKLDPPAAK